MHYSPVETTIQTFSLYCRSASFNYNFEEDMLCLFKCNYIIQRLTFDKCPIHLLLLRSLFSLMYPHLHLILRKLKCFVAINTLPNNGSAFANFSFLLPPTRFSFEKCHRAPDAFYLVVCLRNE